MSIISGTGQCDLTEADLTEADLTEADLYGAILTGAILTGADLTGVILTGAILTGAILAGANLTSANLTGADLTGATLYRANLSYATLSEAILSRAILSEAILTSATLTVADLTGAALYRAILTGAILSEATLSEADLTRAEVGWTNFTNLDLRGVKGLEIINHRGPSSIGIDTLYRSQGQIPESFLRRAGVPEDLLTYLPSLMSRAIEYYTCFISYASQDEDFAQRLYADLQANGVRCWFAPEDMKIGDKIRQRIDESIRLYDKLLLVLSEQSVKSAWVEYEVEAALAKERRESRTVLFPIRLDSAVMESTTAWAAHIKDTRHIGNFTYWKDHDTYQGGLHRLLRDLQPERPPKSHAPKSTT